jgi:NAD(P)-dependent dehydrogenase (short-subunit alcohol dehydrogenase family)
MPSPHHAAMFDLTGRVALVTGASRGLGAAMSAGLARAGAEVILNGRDQATLDAQVAELPLERGAQPQLGEVAKIGMGVCMKNKWLQKKGDLIVRNCDSVTDETTVILQRVESGDSTVPEAELNNLKKRKLVQTVTRKSYRISKGPDFKEKRVRKVADLHKSMLGNKNEVKIFFVFI